MTIEWELFSKEKNNFWSKKKNHSEILNNSQNKSQDFQSESNSLHSKNFWPKELQDRNHTLLPNQRKCSKESTPNQFWLLLSKELSLNQECNQSQLQFSIFLKTQFSTLLKFQCNLSLSKCWESQFQDLQCQPKWSNRTETSLTNTRLLRSNSLSSLTPKDQLIMPLCRLERTRNLFQTQGWEDQTRYWLLPTGWTHKDQSHNQTSSKRMSQFVCLRLSSMVARTSNTSRCMTANCQRTSWKTSAENSTWAREPSSDS